MSRGRGALSVVLLAVSLAASLAGCGGASGAGGTAPSGGVVVAVGAENQYADVIAQIGGPYVSAKSILDNPNTDPHTFESSPTVAREIGGAALVVQNGAGYDNFMSKIESASPNSRRTVIVVQHLLALPNSTPNPHLWYDPKTMPAVASAVAAALSALEPAQAAYFSSQVTAFDQSLQPWHDAIAAFKAIYGATAAATTEPVADYLLTAMGIDNLTPFGFQADIMNGIDPTPQDIALENGFFTKHHVKVFCYNAQVEDSLTSTIRQNAVKAGIAVVAVYETMPTPGYHYQTWMLAEVRAIDKAVAGGGSTVSL